MRVIETDDVEARGAGVTTGTDVILRVNQESRRAFREIRRANRGDERCLRADEDPAAFVRNGFARVSDDGVADGSREDHSVSTIIAMPIPPPMHKAARP